MPSSTTSPIASAQVMRGASENATTGSSPSPAAIAIGIRPMSPMMIDITPATSAITAATAGIEPPTSLNPPISDPVPSVAVPRMRGPRTTM